MFSIPRRYVWSESVGDDGGYIRCQSVPWPIAIVSAWLDQADEVTHLLDRITGERIPWGGGWGNPFCAANLYAWKTKVEYRFTREETEVAVTHDQLTAKTKAWWANKWEAECSKWA